MKFTPSAGVALRRIVFQRFKKSLLGFLFEEEVIRTEKHHYDGLKNPIETRNLK
jgi:hypothetical protein